ncbi:MAG: AsmA family protein, partial [Tangfeifania sp.]
MKKTLIIIGIVVVLLIAALAAIPLFFKETLMEKTKTTINKNVNAKVEFTDLKLSLFRNFPKLTLELTDVTVTGIEEFQNDTLLIMPSLQAKTPLGSLFNREQIGIEEIILESPHVNLIVAETGNANWDIVQDTGKPTEAEAQEESGMELQLEKIAISDADFVYDDKELKMLLKFEDIDFNVSGKMYGTSTELLAEGTVANFLLNYEDASYINQTSLETRTLLNVDYDAMDIEIKENELMINRLPLEVLGVIQMPGDSMFFDLQLKTKESGFDNFLALVPPAYESYLEGIETSGTATITGEATGYYT